MLEQFQNAIKEIDAGVGTYSGISEAEFRWLISRVETLTAETERKGKRVDELELRIKRLGIAVNGGPAHKLIERLQAYDKWLDTRL